MEKKVYLIRMRHVTYYSDKERLEQKKEKILQELKKTPHSRRDPVVAVTLSEKKAQRELEALFADGLYAWKNDEKSARAKGIRPTYSLTAFDYYIETKYLL